LLFWAASCLANAPLLFTFTSSSNASLLSVFVLIDHCFVAGLLSGRSPFTPLPLCICFVGSVVLAGLPFSASSFLPACSILASRCLLSGGTCVPASASAWRIPVCVDNIWVPSSFMDIVFLPFWLCLRFLLPPFISVALLLSMALCSIVGSVCALPSNIAFLFLCLDFSCLSPFVLLCFLFRCFPCSFLREDTAMDAVKHHTSFEKSVSSVPNRALCVRNEGSCSFNTKACL
jgi:hypothetical protein